MAQRHADELVQRALKMLTSVAVETDADGCITGASVEMDDRGERAMLPTTYSPMGKWKERLFRGIKAIVLRDAKDRVGSLFAFGPGRPGPLTLAAQMPADAVLSTAIENCMGGARPLLAECSRQGTGGNGNSRPALGVDLKQMTGFTKTERVIVGFLHHAIRKLRFTKVRYPDETHSILGASIIDDIRQPYAASRSWSAELGKRWTSVTKKLDAQDVQESIARLIASGAIVTEGRMVECKYVKSADGGRRSKLQPGHDVEPAPDVRNNQAAVIRELPSESSSSTALARDFARDTDPSLDGRTFSGLPQMFGRNVTTSSQEGTFTVDARGASAVMLPDRNYVPPDEDDMLPPPPEGAASMFDGSAPFVRASEANERARLCHLRRLFPNLPTAQLPTPATTPTLPEGGPAAAPPAPPAPTPAPEVGPVPARQKRSSDSTPHPDDASAAKRRDLEPAQSDGDESDLDPELDWKQQYSPDEDEVDADDDDPWQ